MLVVALALDDELDVLADEGEVADVVDVDASITNWGSSFRCMMVAFAKQRYMDRGVSPSHKKVPHSPNADAVLNYLLTSRSSGRPEHARRAS